MARFSSTRASSSPASSMAAFQRRTDVGTFSSARRSTRDLAWLSCSSRAACRRPHLVRKDSVSVYTREQTQDFALDGPYDVVRAFLNAHSGCSPSGAHLHSVLGRDTV